MTISKSQYIACSLVMLLAVGEVLADENQTQPSKENVTGKVCHVTATIVGTVKHADAKEVLIEVTSTRKVQQGVPLLSKIPYVNRTFKNVGVAKSVAVIRVPRSQVTAITTCEDKCCSEGYCTESSACRPPPAPVAWRAISRLPITNSIRDGVQYFSPGPEFKLCGVADGCCKASKNTSATKRLAAVGSCCQAKANAKCEDCQCCAGCKCSEPSTAHNVTIHQHLVRVITENAQLKAGQEAQREIASQKEQAIEEIVEAKLEVAKLQTQVELANQREEMTDTVVEVLVQNAKLQAIVEMAGEREELLVHVAKSQNKNHGTKKSKRSDNIQQVKAENAKLKALISTLERQIEQLHAQAGKDSVVR